MRNVLQYLPQTSEPYKIQIAKYGLHDRRVPISIIQFAASQNPTSLTAIQKMTKQEFERVLAKQFPPKISPHERKDYRMHCFVKLILGLELSSFDQTNLPNLLKKLAQNGQTKIQKPNANYEVENYMELIRHLEDHN